MMDARQIQVFRGAMHLLAHRDTDLQLIDDRAITTAIQVAHNTWAAVEETIKAQPHGPVDVAKSFEPAA